MTLAFLRDDPIPCLICKMLLNGIQQYEDHIKGKRHKQNEWLLARQDGYNKITGRPNDNDPGSGPHASQVAAGPR